MGKVVVLDCHIQSYITEDPLRKIEVQNFLT